MTWEERYQHAIEVIIHEQVNRHLHKDTNLRSLTDDQLQALLRELTAAMQAARASSPWPPEPMDE